MTAWVLVLCIVYNDCDAFIDASLLDFSIACDASIDTKGAAGCWYTWASRTGQGRRLQQEIYQNQN